MHLVLALAATVALSYQAAPLLTGVGWALLHGGAVATPVLVAPLALLSLPWLGWFVARRATTSRATVVFLLYLVGVLILTEVWLPQTPLKAARERRIVADVVVDSVSDGLLFSPQGNPIGIRLTYAASFPAPGVYTVAPTMLMPTLPGTTRVHQDAAGMGGTRMVIEPEPEPAGEPGQRFFESGRAYRHTVDVLPHFLFFDVASDTVCLHFPANTLYDTADLVEAVATGRPTRYETSIQVSGRHGTARHEARAYVTATYDVRDFYESAMREANSACDS